MKHIQLFSILIFLFSINMRAERYYVNNLAGSDSYNGKYEFVGAGTNGPFKTLGKAALVAVAGDEVFVRAGNYGNKQITFPNSGTSSQPITFIGYKSYAGDCPILATTATATTTFDTLDMPTFTGSDRATGTCFNLRERQYIIIQNFQIRNYETGFVAGGDSGEGHLTVDNVNIMTLGDPYSSDYVGKGFQFGEMGSSSSNHNSISNCLVLNAVVEAFGVYGDTNTVSDSKAFCNENTSNAATDYYMIVCGSYNTFNTCYVYRELGLTAGAHGIGAKTTAELTVDKGHSDALTVPSSHNEFNYCTAVNLGEGFFVRHRKAQYNKFYHCNAIGNYDGGSSDKQGYCIEIRDGASYNTFDGCTATNCQAAIIFEDTVEDGDRDSISTGHPSFSNTIINCVFINSNWGIRSQGSLNGGTVAEAGNNTIAGCTFYKTRHIFEATQHMQYLKNIGNVYHTGKFVSGTYASDLALNNGNSLFKQNDFYNLTSLPSGWTGTAEANISSDPTFVSSTTPYDLHLQSSSPCKNTVDNLAYNTKDFDNKTRPNGTKSDMGAYEYYASARSSDFEQALSVSDETKEGIIIYPNPSSGYITLISNLDASYAVRVLNLLGQPVYQNSYTTNINLTSLTPGIYFIQIFSPQGENVLIKKITVE